MSAGEVVSPGICEKVKDTQHLCEEQGERMPTSVIGVIELSQKVVEKKRDVTKMMARYSDLVKSWRTGDRRSI